MGIAATSKADRFFTERQRQTIAAAMARVIPTDDTPGAREAGTIDFLDRYLSGIDFIFAKPDGSGFETLAGKQAAAWQQRIAALREKYVAGIEELERVSHALYDRDFVRLAEEKQDRVLATLERPAKQQEAEAETEAALAAAEPALQQMASEADLAFFPLLVLHTRQGFYADPIYGGNRDHLGWRTIGFPGPSSLAETHAGRYSTLPYFARDVAEDGEEATGDG